MILWQSIRVYCRIPHHSQVGKELVKLLHIPIDHYNNVLTLLQLKHFGSVIGHLDYRGRTLATSYIVQNMIDNVNIVTSSEQVYYSLSSDWVQHIQNRLWRSLFQFLDPMCRHMGS